MRGNPGFNLFVKGVKEDHSQMKIKKKSVAGFILLLLLDQLTKLWAVTSLKFSESIPVIPNVLELYYLENRGAAFGMMQNRQWFFLLITVAVLAILIWVSRKIPEEKHFLPLKACIYFIGAGAVGNMIDRVFRKYVVDFIYFTLISINKYILRYIKFFINFFS